MREQLSIRLCVSNAKFYYMTNTETLNHMWIEIVTFTCCSLSHCRRQKKKKKLLCASSIEDNRQETKNKPFYRLQNRQRHITQHSKLNMESWTIDLNLKKKNVFLNFIPKVNWPLSIKHSNNFVILFGLKCYRNDWNQIQCCLLTVSVETLTNQNFFIFEKKNKRKDCDLEKRSKRKEYGWNLWTFAWSCPR